MTASLIILIIIAYLLGSVPSAVWYGKIFHGVDIREHGSGNAGATNTLRVLGNKAGFIVLFFDFMKGFVAAKLPVIFSLAENYGDDHLWMEIITGSAAVAGHIAPVLAGFRGGKGIATL